MTHTTATAAAAAAKTWTGLTSSAFVDAVNDGTYLGYVAKVDDDASRRGVTGTPTVFLDGRPVPATNCFPAASPPPLTPPPPTSKIVSCVRILLYHQP